MNQKMRQKMILNKIKIEKTVYSSELIDQLNVSAMTVRRDLQALEAQGYVELTHGGAIWKGDDGLELPMSFKEDKFVEQKKAIGRYCASLVPNGSVVFIETGTTTQAIVNELTQKQGLTVHTNSLMAANTLSQFDNIELFMAPGRYRELSKGFVGPLTSSYMANFSYDFVFTGTEGIDLDFGVCTHDLDDALTKQSVIANAKNAILVADHNKFNMRFVCKICELSDITTFVTDSGLSDDIFDMYIQRGIDVVRAAL